MITAPESLFHAAAREALAEAMRSTEKAAGCHGCTKAAAEARADRMYRQAKAWLTYESDLHGAQLDAWAGTRWSGPSLFGSAR